MTLTPEQLLDQRVVCAANRIQMLDDCGVYTIVIGPRHYDATMHRLIDSDVDSYAAEWRDKVRERWRTAEQGFIDQWGNFLTRTESWKIATRQGQIVRWVGSQRYRSQCSSTEEFRDQELYSENLY